MAVQVNKWDSFFISVAISAAEMSKDINTKVGAVFVKDKTILSMGYNGAPRKFNDDLVPNGGDRLIEQKNTFMCHAELNAVLNYRGNLTEFYGSTLYVTVFPCHECAKILAQLNVQEVVYLNEYHRKETVEASKYILEQCGVKIRKL